MAGIDENLGPAGDWGASSPIPRTFFSRMLGEDDGAKLNSEPRSIDRTDELYLGTQEFIATGKSKIEDSLQDGTSSAQLTDSVSLSEQKSSSRGGLVERMAARAGFNAPRLNTESIRSADSGICSPYLTIPPGLSPTTLLDSPVFLSNSLAQPSPTTGKFPFIYNGTIRCSELSSSSFEKSKLGFDDIFTSSFASKPATDMGPSFYHGAARKMNPTTFPQQSFPGIEVSVQSENSFQSQNVDPDKVQVENKNGLHLEADFNVSPSQNDNETNFVSADQRAFDTTGGSTENSTPLEEQADEGGCQRGNADSMAAGVGATLSEDGYNWRKYGQKQVKGSEYPRSYYKCTHPNCPVKKKVERSHEGHITEIIYKGAHNHPKPPPNCRSAIGSINHHTDMQVDNPEHVKTQSGGDGGLHWTTVQKGNMAGAGDVKHDNLEVTSSASVGPDYCSQSSTLRTKNGTHFESGDAVDASSTFSNDEDEDDRGTHGSVSLTYDGEGDESESKKRKLESYATELSGATRAIREPRVVVQTTSEVDILDDGYRWRKYGQKVVKGNPNPRSYYKCTSAGCTVRKHVERASHDLKSVITTYEGKHNHDVPAARTSSHVNAAAVTAQVPTVIQRPEPSQVPNNSMGRIEMPALSSFSLPGRQQLGFSFGMNQPALPNLAMAGLGPAQAKLPVMPFHPYFAQRPANELGFMLPKGEPSVDTIPERGLNQEIMSRMPLGPQM